MKIQIEKHDQEFVSFDDIVEKPVDAETKAALKPCFFTHVTNQYCSWDSCPIPIKSYI